MNTDGTGQEEIDPARFRSFSDGNWYLVGGRCRHCSTLSWSIAAVCPSCWAESSQEEVPIGRRGRIYSSTVVRRVPAGFPQDYIIGFIDLDEGLRVMGRIVAEDETRVRPGAPVVLEAGAVSTTKNGSSVIGPVYRAS